MNDPVFVQTELIFNEKSVFVFWDGKDLSVEGYGTAIVTYLNDIQVGNGTATIRFVERLDEFR